eukprot:jgi/Psemu1/39088/gm1.39088_g
MSSSQLDGRRYQPSTGIGERENQYLSIDVNEFKKTLTYALAEVTNTKYIQGGAMDSCWKQIPVPGEGEEPRCGVYTIP